MLVLSRKERERLVIGDNIVITIVRVAGGSVRVGIEAPKDIQIRREEVRCCDGAKHQLMTRVA
jgi:carbon storage regulator